jgi:hypothetical protein
MSKPQFILEDDIEKTPGQHFGMPRSITIQDDSATQGRDLRRFTSGPHRVDAASRIVGEFR